MGILDTTFFQRIKGYKTFGVNGIVVITGLLTALGIMPAGLDAGSISAGVNGILGGAEMILGGVNILLRFITTTPAGSSG